VSKTLYHLTLSLASFRFGETKYLHFTTHVFGHSAIFPFLGGIELNRDRFAQSRSDPDSEQKTETELTFWYVLPYFFIPNHFNRNRNRNRFNKFVPVTFEFVTICDICDHNVTKSVLLKSLKKNQSVWPRSQIQNCDILWLSQMSHIECDWYKTCFCFCSESGSYRLSESFRARFQT